MKNNISNQSNNILQHPQNRLTGDRQKSKYDNPDYKRKFDKSKFIQKYFAN